AITPLMRWHQKRILRNVFIREFLALVFCLPRTLGTTPVYGCPGVTAMVQELVTTTLGATH
ncbi:MAG: hypothetical protein EBZ36_13460, partial [Acidobacteria bacterium]|nr:hypothetical protein [Acidobacteriota bacterium]